MVPTTRGRSWLLNGVFGLITVCLPAVAQPVDHAYRYGAIPLSEEAYQSYLKVTPHREQKALEATLPPAYNAADLGFVTPAKDQNVAKCGACWAFAAVGAMESKLLMSRAVPSGSALDLSEQQQVSCNTEEFGCNGGFLTGPLFWARPPNANSGPLPDSVLPYAASNVPCHNPSGSQLPYRVMDFHTVPLGIAEIKASLYRDGPGPLTYLVMEDFLPFWESGSPNSVYKHAWGYIEGNHMVLLIGWDDAKQAFLFKNSYGATTGPNGDGTFWMSYEDLSGLHFQMANFRVEAETPLAAAPIPVTSHWTLTLAALSLLLLGLKSLRRRV